MILANIVPLQISVITFILNGLLLIVGFLLVGREFGVKTVYTSLLLPLFLRVFEVGFPDFTSINEDPFLDMVCYIFTVSIGLAMLFRENASSGGTESVPFPLYTVTFPFSLTGSPFTSGAWLNTYSRTSGFHWPLA